MNIKVLIILVLAVLLNGCSTAPITVNYAPSSTMTLEGELKVGDFRYLPGEINKDIQPNQIRNTALGSVILEKNIDVYFETAMFTESRFVGIKVKESDTVVSGEIIEFLIDDLGYSIDWALEVKYIVKTEKGTECYNKTHRLDKHTAKFINVFGTLNEVMKLNIEMAFTDTDFASCVAIKS